MSDAALDRDLFLSRSSPRYRAAALAEQSGVLAVAGAASAPRVAGFAVQAIRGHGSTTASQVCLRLVLDNGRPVDVRLPAGLSRSLATDILSQLTG